MGPWHYLCDHLSVPQFPHLLSTQDRSEGETIQHRVGIQLAVAASVSPHQSSPIPFLRQGLTLALALQTSLSDEAHSTGLPRPHTAGRRGTCHGQVGRL